MIARLVIQVSCTINWTVRGVPRLFFVVLLSLASEAVCAKEIRGIPQIVDGDTVYIGNEKIRLSGIDAPETDQICLDAQGQAFACGVVARDKLQAYSDGREWECDLSGRDRYGRDIGTCYVEGEDINQWLVRNGWALAFRRYSVAYVKDEDWAREHLNGMWSGAFIAPWDWRYRGPNTTILGAKEVPTDAQRKLISPGVAGTPPTPGCVIKANLKGKSGCIYHMPGGHYYGRLKMEPMSSRRWFCSAAEAEAAGCRRSTI